jgi:hypothetical protein
MLTYVQYINVRDSIVLRTFCQVCVCKTEFSVTFCISNLLYTSTFYHTFYGRVCHKHEHAARCGRKRILSANTFVTDGLSKKVFVFGLSLTCSTTQSRFVFLLTWLVRLLTLSQRWNVISSLKDIFETNTLSFLCGPLCTCQIHNVPDRYLMLCVATLVVNKAEKPDCLIEFFTYFDVVYLLRF